MSRRFEIYNFLRRVFPSRRCLLLALLGWCLVTGCVPSQEIGPGGAGADFNASNSSLTGVRFEPSFVRDPTLRLAPSSVHWVLPVEQVLVKWEDLYVRADVGEGPKECHLCAALAADAAGMVICDNPQANSYVAPMAVQEIAAITPQGLASFPTDLQVLGLFIWQEGCFIQGASPDQDLGPRNPPQFTVNRSGKWAVVIGGPLGPDIPSRAVTGTKPSVYVPPAVGSPVATIWVVPQGGHLVMDPRTLEPRDTNHFMFSVASRDVTRPTWWTDNFAPTLTVGRVRVYRGKLVDDPLVSRYGPVLQVTPVVPRRIRVYEYFPCNDPDPYKCDIYYCSADPTATTGDGDINFTVSTRCRDSLGNSTVPPLTPAYEPPKDPRLEGRRHNIVE